MNKPLKVYGLPPEVYERLSELSAQRYGKPNISLLARDLLLAESERQKIAAVEAGFGGDGKTRLEIKLPAHLARWLDTAAKQGKMSANRRAMYILSEYAEQNPVLTDNEIAALYQSNVRLGAIGRNLNQIARHLNAGESASLPAKHIRELEAMIRDHTQQVSAIIRDHRKRQEN
ncbi:TPA: plasmid mobilization relaxosome protein MobC [Neisseria meningitidis]